MYTRIIQDYPGHVWVRNPATNQETLAWNPIPGIYSPPCLFYPVFVNRVRVHSLPASIVGLIIGAEGRWLKFITESSGALYLFYRKGEFELWGFTDQSVIQATRMLEGHIHHMLMSSAEGEARGVGHQPVQEVHLEGV